MIRQRVRIRFQKKGDVRMISHRDLVRTFERLFRRLSLRLSMSEGFHPKARMTFPSALSLGVAALDEVMEVELAEHVDSAELKKRLTEAAPAGLEILDVQALPKDVKKAKIERFRYEIPVPADRLETTAEAVERLLLQSSCMIEREGKSAVDVRSGLESLSVDGDLLKMQVSADSGCGARPREILKALGLDDLESQGVILTRTHVELTPEAVA